MNPLLKTIIPALALFLTIPAAFSSLPCHAAGVGTTGAAFLKIGIGARALSMGSAFTAVVDDANAVNWNPASLGALKGQQVTASYNSLFQDQNQGFLAYARPLDRDRGTLGFGINYMNISDIEKRAGDTENPDSTFGSNNYALIVSCGKTGVLPDIDLGASLKYIRQTLDTFTGSAVAMDLGAMLKTSVENLTVGITLQNLGTKIGPDPLPFIAKAGAAYKLPGNRLCLAANVDALLSDERTYAGLGAEYWLLPQLALRAGYQFGRSQDKLGGIVGLGTGIGIKVDMMSVDYALVPFGDLGNTHRITIGARF